MSRGLRQLLRIMVAAASTAEEEKVVGGLQEKKLPITIHSYQARDGPYTYMIVHVSKDSHDI